MYIICWLSITLVVGYPLRVFKNEPEHFIPIKEPTVPLCSNGTLLETTSSR